MRKTKAGERKRTVTIVVGPLTLKLFESVGAEIEKRVPGFKWDLTSAVGAYLDGGLKDAAEFYKNAVPDGWRCHYD